MCVSKSGNLKCALRERGEKMWEENRVLSTKYIQTECTVFELILVNCTKSLTVKFMKNKITKYRGCGWANKTYYLRIKRYLNMILVYYHVSYNDGPFSATQHKVPRFLRNYPTSVYRIRSHSAYTEFSSARGIPINHAQRSMQSAWSKPIIVLRAP